LKIKIQKEMRMRLKVVLLAAAMLAAATAARADLTITVGDHTLLPNMAGQVVPIFVSAQGGEAVQGLQFRVTEGDGGSAVGGFDIGPAMTGDITGPGTVFFPNNVGTADNSVPPMVLDLGTVTGAGSITLPPGLSLLGTITFDTTGLGPGPALGLFMAGPNSLTGDTQMNPFFIGNDPGTALTVVNGSVQIVPEPSSVVLGLFAMAGLGAVAIRRRRAKA
jgi:MYXO-CTERM domain-containing protein